MTPPIPSELDGSPPEASARPLLVIGWVGVVLGLALAPPIFERLFAMGQLLPREHSALWLVSAAVSVAAAVLVLLSSRLHPGVGALFFAVELLIAVELGTRLVVNLTLPTEDIERLAFYSNSTYDDLLAIKAHPFLQYTGRRDANNLGFLQQPDFVLEKPANTIRIATLGGSTTAQNSWPKKLQELLRNQSATLGRSFEVLNFAQIGYSSVHVLIDFVLNVTEYSPDYVVIHTGWNDTALRELPEPAKTDFSNVFKPFELPPMPGRWLSRASVPYRMVQNAVCHLVYGDHPGCPYPEWGDLIAAACYQTLPDNATFDDLSELKPLRRNLEKILALSSAFGMKVVLTTKPHSTDPSIPNYFEAKHIEQCNSLVREIYHEHQQQVLFVDLANEMTGLNDLYIDLAHMKNDNQKAELVAATILADLRATPPPPR